MLRLLLTVFCAVHCALCTSSSSQDTVKRLTKDTFDDAIGNKNTLVLFYVDWCGHCASVKPIFSDVSTFLMNRGGINVAKVNCDDDNVLCSKYSVSNFPTIALFKPGFDEPVKYKGPRTKAGIIDFAEIEAEPNSNTDTDSEPDDVSHLRYQVPDADSEPNDVSHPRYEEGEEPKEEEEVEVLQSSEKEQLPALVELTEDNFAKHVSSGNHFVKFYAPWCSHCQRLAPTWDELAKSLQQNSAVSIAKIDCTQWRSICQDFEVKGYPTLLWIEDGKKIEKYAGSRDQEALKAYVEKMLGTQDTQAPVEQVAEADEQQALKKNVVQLSGDDFAKTIAEGVTFVKFYAPWCGHCQNLSPTWDLLAEKIHNVISGIKIAKVDCTAAENRNLCVNEEVEGYPTLFAYKNGEKQSEYHGSRSLAELQQYVKKFVGHDEL